ncbi:MAG: hypothetical protein JMDDDDMK_00673 [Acidobacteria bacterium]|nr:hypothetical protein [Acidobacteriota bacterium]
MVIGESVEQAGENGRGARDAEFPERVQRADRRQRKAHQVKEIEDHRVIRCKQPHQLDQKVTEVVGLRKVVQLHPVRRAQHVVVQVPAVRDDRFDHHAVKHPVAFVKKRDRQIAAAQFQQPFENPQAEDEGGEISRGFMPAALAGGFFRGYFRIRFHHYGKHMSIQAGSLAVKSSGVIKAKSVFVRAEMAPFSGYVFLCQPGLKRRDTD